MGQTYADIPREITDIASLVASLIDDGDVVRALSLTSRALQPQVLHLERALVQELRGRGESWATIGTALGISRQSAHARFHVG